MRPRRAGLVDMQFLALASKVFWLGIFMPCKRMVQSIVARETDVAQLAIIEVGKSPQRSSTITHHQGATTRARGAEKMR